MSKHTGIYCPACDRQGIDSLIINEQKGMFCQVNKHQWEYQTLMARKPRMQQMVMAEKQPPNTIAQPMWIYPSDLATLQSKFPVNLQTTLCALFHALVDDDTVLLEGQYARELADLSKELNMTITKGRDIVGLAKAYIEVKKSLDEARMQQKVLEPVLKLIGALGGGQQATNGLGALSALLGTGSQQPAIDPDSLALPPQTQFPQIIDPDDPEYYHQQPQAASNQPPPPRPKPLPAGAVSPIAHIAKPQDLSRR